MAAAGAVFYNKIHLKKVFNFTTRDTSGQWGDPSLISISIDCAANTFAVKENVHLASYFQYSQ